MTPERARAASEILAFYVEAGVDTSVGEMPIDGPAPAVVNALRHVGFDIRSIPATPERLMNAAARAGATR